MPVNASETITSYRVLVIEDDVLLAAELCRLIDATNAFGVVACAGDFAAGRDLLKLRHDVLVVDVGLPDGDGIALLDIQQQLWPAAKSLVMTVFDDRDTTTRALAAGADGYVVKTDPHFITHLGQIINDEHPIDAAVTGYLVETLRREPSVAELPKILLTPREQQTLERLSLGLSYREIATELNVSPHTVTDYIKGVYRKLEVKSRSEAVYAGVRLGLVDFG